MAEEEVTRNIYKVPRVAPIANPVDEEALVVKSEKDPEEDPKEDSEEDPEEKLEKDPAGIRWLPRYVADNEAPPAEEEEESEGLGQFYQKPMPWYEIY